VKVSRLKVLDALRSGAGVRGHELRRPSNCVINCVERARGAEGKGAGADSAGWRGWRGHGGQCRYFLRDDGGLVSPRARGRRRASVASLGSAGRMARVSRVAAVAPQAGGGVAASCGHGDCKSTEASRRSVHRGEPDLERDFSRDDVDRGERVLRGGRKRQAVQQKAGARHSEKCSQRQSSRARSSSSSASEWGSGAAAGRGAIVGSSIMLNKMPVELLENVLSCKFWSAVRGVIVLDRLWGASCVSRNEADMRCAQIWRAARKKAAQAAAGRTRVGGETRQPKAAARRPPRSRLWSMLASGALYWAKGAPNQRRCRYSSSFVRAHAVDGIKPCGARRCSGSSACRGSLCQQPL
jgi:hypothetical protein